MSPDQRKKVEARAVELIAEETTLRLRVRKNAGFFPEP